MTNLGLLLCPCAGFGWNQAQGYCPLPEASPTVYDPNQPYGAEKQPYVDNPPDSGADELPLFQFKQYSAWQCGDDAHALPLPGYPDQEHLQLASPPESVKDVIFPRDGSSLAHFPDDYMTADLQPSGRMAFDGCYAMNFDQPQVNQVPEFSAALGSHFAPLQSMGAWPHVLQLNMLAPEAMADRVPVGSWGDAYLPLQLCNVDTAPPEPRGGKRGPFKDDALRKKTAQTRRIGSCTRCRFQRIRCESDPGEPAGICLTCENVVHNKAERFPCLRYKLTDVKLYKPGQVPGYEWTHRWTNSITDPIQKWASPEIKVIHVSAGFSTSCIELQVRKFIPQDGDKLERTWVVQGMKKSVSIPPYALTDLEATKSTYSTHIQDIMTDTIRHVLKCNDGLLCETYFRAVQLMRDPSTPADSVRLLSLTLMLWVAIRLSTTSGFLVGEESLGMPRNILDETRPDAGKIPMPPVLGAQLDLVLIHHIQTKLRREMLDVLQRIVLRNKQATWFVTYLVTFILLHNTALITSHDAGYARKHGMKRRYAREDKVREYHEGAKILLGYFHYCNKGMYPFSDECKDKDLRKLADLSQDELQLVHATRLHVKQRRREWEQLRARGAYEDDFFFVSQLFVDNWTPLSTI